MGGTCWSDDTYNARTSHRKSIGSDGFDYDKLAADIAASGGKLEPHKTMNIKGVALRESRDSDAHPESVAISVLMDVTGSMRRVPKLLQKKLNTLMAILLKKNYVDHPQIMFGAIGDAVFDEVPIQIGQWESGIEQDDNLTNLVLEGGGGNGLAESHGLSMYFLANHTAMDCLEKRNKKGYLFIITDEPPYDAINKAEVEQHIGDTLQANIPIEEVANRLKEKFNVFVLLPSGTSNWGDKAIKQTWTDLFGQNVVEVKDPNDTTETIASLIGIAEGRVDVDELNADLKQIGVDAGTVNNVTTAISKYVKNTGIVKRDKAAVEGTLPTKKVKETATRL